MKATIKKTNGQLYDSKCVDVDLDLKVDENGNGSGSVWIDWIETDAQGNGEGKNQCWTGEHASTDYEEDFGFIIVPEEETNHFTNH